MTLLPVVIGLLACNGVHDRAQQLELATHHIESVSGTWVAGKSVEDGKWVVEIQGRDGSRYRDEPGSLGTLQVYWDWDEHDRLWMYDSDDGTLRYWSGGPDWKRQVWDIAYTDTDLANYLCQHTDKVKSPAPPVSMFPFKLNATARGKLTKTLGKECKPPAWEYQ